MKYKKYFRKTSLKQKGVGSFFLNEISIKSPKVFLEVGVFHGVTARNVCELLQKIHGNDFKYVGVDLFEENIENKNEVIPNTKFLNPLKNFYFNFVKRQNPYSLEAVNNLLKKFQNNVSLIKGNSNKILFELIQKLNSDFDVKICSIDGGGLRNAIPRESSAIISFDEDNLNSFKKIMKNTSQTLVAEFKETDDNINLEFELLENRFQTIGAIESKELINAINECPNGVFEMSENIEGLVETSNNLANIRLIEGKLKIQCLTRSSSENSKDKLSKIISNIFENIGCDSKFSGGYPGWEPNLNSATLKEVKDSYITLFSSEPKVNVIHAGLECGIIGSHYPEMGMISFGPTILGAHSPDEKASISSTQKFWRFFREILSNIPEKVN